MSCVCFDVASTSYTSPVKQRDEFRSTAVLTQVVVPFRACHTKAFSAQRLRIARRPRLSRCLDERVSWVLLTQVNPAHEPACLFGFDECSYVFLGNHMSVQIVAANNVHHGSHLQWSKILFWSVVAL